MLSPHPDDELIPAGGALITLRDAGWRIENLALGLGRPHQHDRRRAEVEEACARAGFDLVVREPPLALSRDDDLAAAELEVERMLVDRLAHDPPELLLAPQPHDGHHAHELVGRAARAAVEARAQPLTVWWWSLWGELSHPTLIVPIDAVLARVVGALAAHGGENARNDYTWLVTARAAASAILGPERVLGFGSPGLGDRHVELLAETRCEDAGWRFGAPRRLDPADPTSACAFEPAESAGSWLADDSHAARTDGRDRVTENVRR
jgi:LmbE family N-acetylglucosaminyl deacetylase